MFRRRRTAGPGFSAPAPRLAPDRAVRAAEEIVRRAWAYELLRRRDHLDLARSAAYQAYDTAQVRLAAARRDGNPWNISVARAAVLLASTAADDAAAACRQDRKALRGQLRLLKHRSHQFRRSDTNAVKKSA